MLSSRIRIFVSTSPTDMRKSFDGLSRLVREDLNGDPLSGDLFVFRNRRGDRLKLLLWDRGGFWLFYKYLERGTFRIPPAEGPVIEIDTGDLSMILEGIELAGARRRRRWDPPGERLRDVS
jgi:transposase